MKLFFTFNLTFLGLTAVIAVPEAQGEQSERRDAQLNYGDHCENNTGICLFAGGCEGYGGSFDYKNPCATPAWPEPIECCVKIGCPDSLEGVCTWPENCSGTTQSAGQCTGGQMCCL